MCDYTIWYVPQYDNFSFGVSTSRARVEGDIGNVTFMRKLSHMFCITVAWTYSSLFCLLRIFSKFTLVLLLMLSFPHDIKNSWGKMVFFLWRRSPISVLLSSGQSSDGTWCINAGMITPVGIYVYRQFSRIDYGVVRFTIQMSYLDRNENFVCLECKLEVIYKIKSSDHCIDLTKKTLFFIS